MAITTLNNRSINRSDTAASSQVWTATSATASDFQAAGIVEVDMWRISTGYTGSNNPITANWERADTDNFAVLGTGLSQSSGIFTFPSTGYYFITFHANFARNGDSRGITCAIKLTENNSSYSDLATAATFVQQTDSDSTTSMCKTSGIAHCDDVANVKIAFSAGATDVVVNGNSAQQETGFTCIKLADT